ncbi:MAG: zeta toxin family protein [Prevotellaceae bacterium]|nr:zeta toxin family protein [Prevotellaceae bacterium]
MPVAIILGGQNASGKSSLGSQFIDKYKLTGVGMAKVEGDALREYHPNYDKYVIENDKMMVAYTARDSALWTERLIKDLGISKRNMLIETTLRNPEVVARTAGQLALGGYVVYVKIFVVSYDKSLLGCYERYERMKAERGNGRFVHDHSLKAAYNQMPATVEKLKEQGHCACIHLYTRTGVLFEDNYKTANLSEIIIRERNRRYTREEIKELKAGWNYVAKQMYIRHAGKEEFAEVSMRMDDRIRELEKEQTQEETLQLLIDIKRDFLLGIK